ncbi:MAG TPA: choice-of-anchor L domain-containing protein [Flavipsychrobacter sp.]|nr:choice-of-anchor L domain-containing protein [Flavipsychrobacter sp.]
MNFTNTKRLLLLLIVLMSFNSNGQLTVTNNQTALQLVQRLVGSNVTVLNPVLNCPGAHNANFTSSPSNLGLTGGIILATGTATDLNNDVNFFVGQTTSSPGDAQLDSIAAPNNTNDACVLEFDFVPDVDSAALLSFEYVFGSEEYPEFACSPYNDVFAFFLSGPGYNPPVNIALVPGTNIPVAINSINMAPTGTGYSLGTCQGMGAGSPFTGYYVDNLNQPGSIIALDGFTTVLQASAIIQPCDTYHMKLAIANVSDHAYQSAVFLRENSFTVDTVTLDLSGVLATDNGYLIEGCTPATITASRTMATPRKKKICLDFSGTAVNGVDYPFLADSIIIQPNTTSTSVVLNPFQDNFDEPGFETIKIRRLNCCSLEPIDSVVIQVRDSLKMSLLSKDTTICGGSGLVTLHASGDPLYDFSWTPPAGIANPNDTLTTVSPTTTTTYTVTASYGGCPTLSRSFTAFVEPIPIVSIAPTDTNFCIRDPYLLNAQVEPSWFQNYTYTWTPTTHLDDPTVMQPYFYTKEAGTTTYVLTVNTPIGCIGSDSITITARPLPVLVDVTPDFTAKYGDIAQLNAGGATFYTWTPTRLLDYPNEKDPKATATDTATFQVIGTDKYGCRDTAYVKMDIDYTMFEMIPNAFSPNGDGRNDVFSVKNMKFQRLIEFRVFNRWGQEIFSTTDANRGWDGTHKGIPQEIGVYHYLIRITTPNGLQRTYKGDVSLLR